MSHPRKDIRDAVASLLLDADITDVGDSVFKTRVVPHKHSDLPIISVYTGSDQVDPDSRETAPREMDRTVEMTIEILALQTATQTADDALDALELEVLQALGPDSTLGGTCLDFFLQGSEPEFSKEGDTVSGSLKMIFDVFYHQDCTAVDPSDLDDLETVSTEFNLDGEQDEDDSADDLVEGLEE